MLALSVNTIAIERGQKQDDLKEYYYKDQDTFVEKGQFDTNSYTINEYNLDVENNIVSITIYKNNGTGNQYEYEIDLTNGTIKFKNREEIVDPNKSNTITYEKNGGDFGEGAEVIYEYNKGVIVGFVSPVKEGAAFEGWYLNSDFSGTSISQTTKDTDGDITLYAKWIKETSLGYFQYSTSNGQDTIIGLTDIGKQAYDEGKDDIINLVIPKKSSNGNPVVAIGNAVFQDCNKIKKVVIPNEVTDLKENSFKNCTGLKDLTIPITIDASYFNENGSCNFEGCTGLNNIKFTKGTTGIGYDYSYYSFTPWYRSRENEITIELEEGIESIGENMFRDCTGIKSVLIPTTLKTLGNYAFANCSKWNTQLNVSQFTEVGSYAFMGCTGITGTIEISSQIKNGIVPVGMFYNCTGIEKLIIPNEVTALKESSFKNCTGLKDLTIPITIDASYANGTDTCNFEYCTGLKNIKFTKGTTGIGYDYSYYSYTPWYMSSKNEITIELEEGIESIGENMFRDCTGIKSVLIPTTLKTLGNYAFANCSKWNTQLDVTQFIDVGSYAFMGCTGITGTIEISSQIKNGIVPVGMFYNCTGIEKLIIPNEVTALKESAFKNCKGLKDLTIPITIDASYYNGYDSCNFEGCTGLNNIKFTKGTTGIGYNYSYYSYTPWYRSNSNTKKIIIDKGITVIGNNTFNGLTNATFYYTGSQEEWSNVKVGTDNTINIQSYNYTE